MNNKAKEYIQKLKLKPHPEGGYFKEIYRAGEMIRTDHLPARYKSHRNFSTSIYFLLEGNQFSAFHLLQSDELWHFYDGCTVNIYLIDNKGNLSIKKLGRENKNKFQVVIEKHNWFAADLADKNSFALFGCTVSPGFSFEDFKLGNRNELIIQFPQHKELILKLTDG